jgi:alpha-tubulin suppressor-like RCC1 family protein
MNDVTVFGVSKGGSLGVTTNNVPLAPTKPELINTLPPIIDIICGEAFTFIRCENNDIYFCGDNPTFLFFELEETEIRIPTKLRYFEERGIIIREIHVGRSHASFVSTTNDVYYSGGNDYFQRGIPRMDHQPNNHPRLNKMDNLLFNHETVITAPCGVYSSLVQTETQDESHLWIFGCDYFDTPQMYNNIVQIDTRCLGSQRIVQISHGFCFFLVLTNLGNVGICGLSKSFHKN